MNYYRTGEVANLVGISKRTLQKWLNLKKIPAPGKAGNGYYLWSTADIKAVQEYKIQIEKSTRYQFGGHGNDH